MHAAIAVWIVWIAACLAGGGCAVVAAPRARPPAWWRTMRERIDALGQAALYDWGRPATAAAVYLLGAAAILLLCWPLGLLAHALEDLVDWPTFRWFSAHQVPGGWSHAWRRLTNVGQPRLTQEITAVSAVFFAVVWGVRRQGWWKPLIALPLGYVLVKQLQIILQDVVHRGHPPTTLGTFPSGGCARVIVIYGMVVFMLGTWLWPRSKRMWAAGWALVACLWSVQAYARTYNLEHWITDVVGGTVFGCLLLAVMTTCLRVLIPDPSKSASGATRHVFHPAPRARALRASERD